LQSKHNARAENFIKRVQAISYGGDYNPEQWRDLPDTDAESVWQDDVRLMQLAHVNMATVGVFSWVSLQPDEHTFTFDWLDRIMDLLAERHIFVCLGTGTAAQPAWLSQNYPDVLPVDEHGVRRRHGNRQNYCPTSPDFRRLSQNLARCLAERYHNHPALAIWHVSNEYGPYCYCERCAVCFREWLQARYGSLSELNRHWNATFWGHTYTDWQQIDPPGYNGESSMQGLSLDYQRFMSDMNLECYRGEADVLHEITPDIPVTTNFMLYFKPLDYFSWGPYLDIVSWDSYPDLTMHPASIAFWHDVIRGIKDGQSWLLLEQTPSQTQWKSYNLLNRPGVLRQHSYQAVAHGADAVMYFQWRQSRGAAEMFHGAVVSHAGHEHTRVFQDVAVLGSELAGLGSVTLGTRLPSRVAMMFSWSNWWNVEYRPGPSRALKYDQEALRYYQALWEQNIPVDVITPDHDLDGYDLVIAPLLNMVSKEQGASIEHFVEQGGTFVTSYFSGVVDEDGQAWLGGYPGPLRRTLGIWVEEFDPLPPEMKNQVVIEAGGALAAGSYECSLWCDLVNLEGATALGHFGSDFYAGRPAITQHDFGKGRALYVATRPAQPLLNQLFCHLLSDLKISAPLTVPEGVEVTLRTGEAGDVFFLLNHNAVPVPISLPEPMRNLLNGEDLADVLTVPEKGIAVLKAR
jgi:beta-galactosidase